MNRKNRCNKLKHPERTFGSIKNDWNDVRLHRGGFDVVSIMSEKPIKLKIRHYRINQFES